jgi:hypothetical protein
MSTTPANLNTVYGLNLTQTDINDIQTYLSGLGDLNPDGSINVQTSGLFAFGGPPPSLVEQTPPTPHLYLEQPVGQRYTLTFEGTNLPDIAAFISEDDNTILDAFSNNIHIYEENGGRLTLTNTDTGNMTIFNDNSVVEDDGVGNNTINNYNGLVYAFGTNDTVNQYADNNGATGYDHLYGGSGMITAYIHAGDATGGSGNGQIFELMNDSNGSIVTGGSGSNQILEDFGTNDQLIGGSGAYQTLNGENSRNVIRGGSGAHQTLIGGTLGGDLIEGTGDFQTATGIGPNEFADGGSGQGDVVKLSGADGTIYGGSSINQLLEATGINSTMTDGGGANQQLTATGGNSTININIGLSDTVTTQGSGNVINVANLAGAAETIHGAATDTLNFADSWQNATVTADGSGGWKIAFADTGGVDDVTGISQATFAGVLHTLAPPPPPPPPVVTNDLNQADLASLLGSLLDSNHASLLETWAANHLPADGLTPLEVDSIAGNVITGVTADAEGTDPQFLELTGNNDLLDTTNANFHAVLLADSNPSGTTTLTVGGYDSQHIFTSDLANPVAGHNFSIDASDGSVGEIRILMGDDSGDFVRLGAGANSSAVLGIGTGDQAYLGTGANQHVTTNGADATITDDGGSGAVIKSLGGSSTLNLAHAGGFGSTETATASGGNNTVNIGAGDAEITLHLDGGNNVVNVNFSQPTLGISGIGSTDVVHFNEPTDTFAGAIITKTTDALGHKITEVLLTPVNETVTMNGWHDAATFGIDPTIHYI